MPVPDAKLVASFVKRLNGAISAAVSATEDTYPGRITYAAFN